MPSRGAVKRLAVAVGGLVLVALASCTASEVEPEPPPAPVEGLSAGQPSMGVVIAVVLPPVTQVEPAVRRAIEVDVARLATTLGPEVRDVRTMSPDEPAFVGDLVALLADEGTDLVCLVGASASGLWSLADLHPGVRFCATADTAQPAGPGEPELVEVRAEELGHVVGVAALAAAGTDGSVGLVLGGDDLPSTAFRSGLVSALGEDIEVVEDDVDEGVTNAMDAVLDAGATVVVVDGVLGAAEAVAAVDGRAQVLAPGTVIGMAATDAILSWRMRWDVVLRRPVAGVLGWADRGPASYGLAEEVFGVVVRPGASSAVRDEVETAIAQLRAGTRDPVVRSDDPEDGTHPEPSGEAADAAP